jgi:hypothetical protein
MTKHFWAHCEAFSRAATHLTLKDESLNLIKIHFGQRGMLQWHKNWVIVVGCFVCHRRATRTNHVMIFISTLF